jgi:hypothetical protein
MAIDILDVFTPDTQPEWLTSLLTIAQLLGFPGTSWRPGPV